MAGGMDWFRWHHGSVTDPKFALIAKKSGVNLAAVLATWAMLLEAASQAADRGSVRSFDFEAADFHLGLEEGKSKAIYGQMVDRGLVDIEGQLTAWASRQTKRERDDNSTSRVQAFRARKRDETPRNANLDHETPRGEERREEEKEQAIASVGKTDLPACRTQEVVAAYHAALPELASVRLTTDRRRKAISKFWRWVLTSKKSDGGRRATTAEEALAWVKSYFERARENPFLMGVGTKAPGHEGWRCDFDFLLTEKGMKHVIEKTVVAQ